MGLQEAFQQEGLEAFAPLIPVIGAVILPILQASITAWLQTEINNAIRKFWQDREKEREQKYRQIYRELTPE
jgi:hypothetical protein